MFIIMPLGMFLLISPFVVLFGRPSPFRELCKLGLAFMLPSFLILAWSSNGFGLWGPMINNGPNDTQANVVTRTYPLITYPAHGQKCPDGSDPNLQGSTPPFCYDDQNQPRWIRP